MNVPSGLHDSTLVFALGIALTARLSPPAAGTRYAFRNDRVLRPRYATHLLSEDHARFLGDALMKPFAMVRSCFDDRSITTTALSSRTKASMVPSGENFG